MRVAALHVFPVKSLRGGAIPSATVEPWGLAQDRRWMVVDKEGKFLTQRQLAAMALVQAEVTGAGVRLSRAGAEPIEVPRPPAEGEAVEVTIWRDRIPARSAGPAVAVWLSAALGQHCRLVWLADPTLRPVNPTYGAPGESVSFADTFPLLLGSLASLADLNARLAAPIPMLRFRPNLVVEGSAPWAEDTWRRLRIGDVTLRVVKPCDRCIITTIDPATGERPDKSEPLRTLGLFRRDARGGVMFGQNAIPETTGRLEVGMPVEVLEAGAPNVELVAAAEGAAAAPPPA